MVAKDPNKELVASVLTMFANGSTVAEIKRAHKTSHWTVNKIIDRYWLTKRKTEQTETIILKSKL